MDESGLFISMSLAAFTFVLGWLIGIERKNYFIKELTFWKAYAREEENKNKKRSWKYKRNQKQKQKQK